MHARATSIACAVLFGTFLSAAVTTRDCRGQGDASPKSPLETFRALDTDVRSSIARSLRRRLQRDSDPDVQRLLDYSQRFRDLPLAAKPVAYRAEVWAKGAAPKRKLLRAESGAWKEVAKRFPEVPVLPRLQRHVHYSWERARIERTSQERITDDQLFENLLRGYAPGSGDAFASVLEILDRGAKQADAIRRAQERTRVAAWAGHLYADLDARAFEGITLWRAWHASEVVDVPDVDAIPFAKHVLGENDWKSPIPADARRAGLYERIRRSMREYRVARELREVAAATWLTDAPRLDKGLRRMVRRMHQVWAECEDDPKRMATRLAAVRDRDAFLEELDDAAGKDAKVYEAREDRRRRLARSRARLRDMARAALRR